MEQNGPWIREGLVAGLIGAAAVAAWFLIVDVVNGQALYTPSLLGSALFSLFGSTAGESAIMHILGYTVFHVAAFCGIGVLASLLATVSDKVPAAIGGLLILFIAFEVGFYGVTAMLSMNALLGGMAWWSIGVANLLAAGGMGYYLYRHHPQLKANFADALVGANN